MKFFQAGIPEVYIVESKSYQDDRGSFSRIFCEQELKPIIGERIIVQINVSVTHQTGAVRGLHFQYPPYAEMKIVRCLKGRVFDVAVDVRRGSPTFLEWISVELSPEKNIAFAIPEGFAHGFQALEEKSELLYLHTAAYKPEAEGAIRYDDPKVGVQWPLLPTDISVRDRAHNLLPENFEGLVV